MASIKRKTSAGSKKLSTKNTILVKDISQMSLQPKRHFNFDNGDEYDGEFAIHLATKKIVRHGFGAYTTISCVRFEGEWSHDRLIDIVKIQYPNGHWFEGRIDEKLDAMIGTLFLVDGSKFIGQFSKHIGKNETVYGELHFFDCNGRQWKVNIQDDVIHLTRDRFI